MQRIQCQNCSAALDWDGLSEIVRCAYCGTLYRMHPRKKTGSGVRTGLGTVSEIQTTQGRYAGHALAKSFIPKDWTVETNAPEQSANLLSPLTIQAVFSSPNKDAVITFTGTKAYNHLDPTQENAPMQGQMGMGRMVGLFYRDASAVCDGIVQANPSLRDVRLLSATDTPDPQTRQIQEKIVTDYAGKGLLSPGSSWSRKYLSVRDGGGQLWYKQVEAMVNHIYLPVPPEEQMMYQMLLQNQQRSLGLSSSLAMRGRFAGLMAGMMTPKVEPPKPKLRWEIYYTLETSATESAIKEAARFHDQIRDTIEVLPLFKREEGRIREILQMQAQQESAALNNALGQMQQEQMASWDRKQKIIQGASDYGSNVMHQMFDSNAQTMNRVNNLRSESIRGVNTYFTNSPGFGVPPVVEASTQWDHVYQNSRYPDYFAASEGAAPLDFGVDFEELGKTGGDY